MRKIGTNCAIWLGMIVGLAALSTGSAIAATDPVSNWNSIAIQAAISAGQNGVTGSRTLAMVHVAIHDALNAIDSRYERYAFTGTAPPGASVEAAIAAATWNALIA